MRPLGARWLLALIVILAGAYVLVTSAGVRSQVAAGLGLVAAGVGLVVP